jgi:hypothetical protein
MLTRRKKCVKNAHRIQEDLEKETKRRLMLVPTVQGRPCPLVLSTPTYSVHVGRLTVQGCVLSMPFATHWKSDASTSGRTRRKTGKRGMPAFVSSV